MKHKLLKMLAILLTAATVSNPVAAIAAENGSVMTAAENDVALQEELEEQPESELKEELDFEETESEPESQSEEAVDTEEFASDEEMENACVLETGEEMQTFNQAASIPSGISGTCGTNAAWTLSTSGVLTISGIGSISDYEVTTGNTTYSDGSTDFVSSTAPWSDYRTLIKQVVIKEGITTIGKDAFHFCTALTSVSIPDSVKTIKSRAFANTALETITIPSSVTSMEGYVFMRCFSLKNVTLSGSISELRSGTFSYCKALESINIPEGVKVVQGDAFYTCSALKSVTFPSSMTTFNNNIFSNCYDLSELHFNGDAPSNTYGDFLQSGNNLVVYCKPQYFENYKGLLQYTINRAESGFSGRQQQVKICTGGTPASLSDSYIGLTPSAVSYRLYAAVGTNTSGLTVKWYSSNPDVASVSSNGTVTAGGMHGAAIVYAVISDGTNSTLVSCYVSSMKNDTLVGMLPKGGLKADFSVQCSTTAYEAKTGKLTSIAAAKFVETDTSNETYQEILSVTNNLVKNCSTDYEKAKAIQTWVSSYLSYGGRVGVGDNISLIYAIYQEKQSHCQGYAYLTGLMLYMAGIPNGIVSSYVSSAHMWNIAYLDNRWVMIDSTWNEFDFDYNDSDHGYIDYISFGENNLCFVVYNSEGIKLCASGRHELHRDDVVEVTVPDYVKIIMSHAFAYCDNLKKVTIPGSVNEIAASAFYQSGTFTMYGETGSAAEQYAKSNGITFVNAGTVSAMSGVKIAGRAADALRVGWTKNTSAEGYIVEQNKNGTWTRIARIADNNTISYRVEKLSPSTEYQFRVKAFAFNSSGQPVYSDYVNVTGKTNPGAVTGLQIGGRAIDALRLNWTQNSTASGYIIDQYKNGVWSRIARIGSNDILTYRVEGLDALSSYQLRIQTFSFDGSTPLYSAYSSISGTTLPTAVTGLKIGGTASDALRLNWNKNSKASGYIIEQYKNGAWARIARIASNSTVTYRVEKLNASTTCQFRIKSFGFDGTTPIYSGYQYITGKTNPSAVTGLKIGGRAADALRLNWDKNSSASGYIIEQNKNGIWVRIARIEGNSTVTYRVENLSASTMYQFRVKAFGFNGSTPLYSTYQNISGTTLPTAVTGLKIGGTARDALRLNWNKNTTASGYIIEQYENGGWMRIARIGTNSIVTYRVEKLQPAASYVFRIQSFGFEGSTPLYSTYQLITGITNK